jgi:hypothetical protein
MSVVLGGSRKIDRLPGEIYELLTSLMSNSVEFIVGDAVGIDLAFQRFFSEKKYFAVTVYSSAGYVRNNVGHWPEHLIESGLKSKSNAVHAVKDRKMVEIAESGIMIWDCQSAGTLSNVIDLLSQGKNCYVWVSPDSDLYQFDNPTALDKWMESYSAVRTEALKRLSTYYKRESKRANENSQPELFG